MEDDEPATADAEGLRRFLEREVFPWFVDRRKALLNRALICEQAFGEALDADKLEQLVRYEVHLDRKLERMLAMLFGLRALRHGTNEGKSVWQKTGGIQRPGGYRHPYRGFKSHPLRHN